jgi:hypothetical protein
LKAHLFFLPGMRKDRVGWSRILEEFAQFKRPGMKKAHRGGSASSNIGISNFPSLEVMMKLA